MRARVCVDASVLKLAPDGTLSRSTTLPEELTTQPRARGVGLPEDKSHQSCFPKGHIVMDLQLPI
jgi:hypothetical protein